MNFLLVNDDGYDALGIKLLALALSEYGDVYVCAPHTNQSGKAHSISIQKKLTVYEREPIIGTVKAISVVGTPVDCVRVGLKIFSQINFDCIISGCNSGHNMAGNALYSGTIAAASEGNLLGYPVMAFSACDINDEYLELEISRVLNEIFKEKLHLQKAILNINFPYKKSLGTKISVLGKELFHTDYSKGDEIDTYFIKFSILKYNEKENTDIYFNDQGYTTITPLTFDKTDFNIYKKLVKFNEKD